MKYLISILSLVFISFTFIWNVSAWFWDDSSSKVPYCENDSECWLEWWINAIKQINDLETQQTASEFIQSITAFILWFVYLIAVILIIYAWFNLLTWVWDEEKAKKSKTMISYVIIWILIIFLAWPIVEFIIQMLNN